MIRSPPADAACVAHMRIRGDGHMHPVPLAPQLRTRPRTRERVIDLPLGRVDLVNLLRGAERPLYVGRCDKD